MIRSTEARPCFPSSNRIQTLVNRASLRAFLCGCFFLVSVFARAQNPQPQPAPTTAAPAENMQPQTQQTAAEITSRDQPATFKVNVKLVVVRAVVRDAQGHPVGNLHKEDFQIFDRGKPQVITQFEVEQPGDLTAKARQAASEESANSAVPDEPRTTAKDPGTIPERFIAYLFDDIHLEFGDLATVRNAAERHFATLRLTDRAAIFTTSGQNNLGFTDDRAKLHEALLRLLPRPISTPSTCPVIGYYQADLIVNKNDPQASSEALQEALACQPTLSGQLTSSDVAMATALVNMTSQQILATGDHESQISLGVLKEVVRAIAHMPGQRSVVVISPGFIAPQMEFAYTDTVDYAVRSQVVINTMNARGLYTILPPDVIHTATGTVTPPAEKGLIEAAAALANDDLLEVLADGTGGIFFHNSNDLDEGFRRVAQAPEYSYVLAFSPPDLKLDGNFHPIKVKLKNSQKFSIQARRGYFAPKHFTDPNEAAKQEIEEALYSQDELHALPVKLHTQFFKAGDDAAKLIVLAHVDVQRIHYKKADGRNNDVLTCVSAVFNRNGNFLQAMEKTVTMHWKDETLQNKLSPGVTLRSSFDVKPGSYLVRLVVRDSEGQLMSAENGTVEIR